MVAYTKTWTKYKRAWYNWRYFNVTTGVVQYGTPFRAVDLTNTLNGNTLPNWRDLVAHQEDATTDLSATRRGSAGSHGFYVVKVKNPINNTKEDWDHFTVQGDFAGVKRASGLPSTTSAVSGVDNRARAKYYSAIRGASQQLAGLVALGEMGETYRMLRKPAESIVAKLGEYVSALSKYKKRSPEKWRKAIAGLWLENSFGLQPLLNDCNDAVKAYEAARQREPVIHISAGAKGSKEQATATTTYTLQVFTPRVIYFKSTERTVLIQSVRYKGLVKAKIYGREWDYTANQFGFSWNQFAPTAWELLPWSFLIDYFGNIGDVIEAGCTSTAGVAWSNMTDRRVSTLTLNVSADTDGLNALYGAKNVQLINNDESTRRYTFTQIQRSRAVQVRPPDLQAELPGTSGQFANMLALWLQCRTLNEQIRPPNFGRMVRAGGRLRRA